MEDRNERTEPEGCEAIIPGPDFDPEEETEQEGHDDGGRAQEDTTVSPEIRPAEAPSDLNNLAYSDGFIALVYRCGLCGKTGFVPDQGAMMASERGVGVAIKCALCKGDIVVRTKAGKKMQQLVQPANVHQMPRNRHERLAQLKKMRDAAKGQGWRAK